MNRIEKLVWSGLLVLLLLPGPVSAQRAYIGPSDSSNEDGPPFSSAVMVGDTLYISGTLGLEGRQVPEDPADEARNLLDSIQNILVDAGMTMDDLVYVQIFCSDVGHYDVFNRVYRSYFSEEFPARAFIGAGTLLFNARFEMQAIAVKRQ